MRSRDLSKRKVCQPKKLRIDEAKVEALGSEGHFISPQSLLNDSTQRMRLYSKDLGSRETAYSISVRIASEEPLATHPSFGMRVQNRLPTNESACPRKLAMPERRWAKWENGLRFPSPIWLLLSR